MRIFASALVCLIACGGGTSDVDSGTMPPDVDSGSTGTDTGPPGVDSGSTPASCTAPRVTSSCGPNAVVRVVATLPATAPAANGQLVGLLNHLRLGNGAAGGVPHTAGAQSVTLAPGGSSELQFDFCAGGEMWSEENCEYVLIVFVDANGNMTPDPGEPSGQTQVSISCHATSPPCASVTLDCTAGASCLSFADPPGGCSCAAPDCSAVGSSSRIILCSP
jgi:hypothetical protein